MKTKKECIKAISGKRQAWGIKNPNCNLINDILIKKEQENKLSKKVMIRYNRNVCLEELCRHHKKCRGVAY